MKGSNVGRTLAVCCDRDLPHGGRDCLTVLQKCTSTTSHLGRWHNLGCCQHINQHAPSSGGGSSVSACNTSGYPHREKHTTANQGISYLGPHAQLLRLRCFLSRCKLVIVRALLAAARAHLHRRNAVKLWRTRHSSASCSTRGSLVERASPRCHRCCLQCSARCLALSELCVNAGRNRRQRFDMIRRTRAQPAATTAAATFSPFSPINTEPNSMPGAVGSV